MIRRSRSGYGGEDRPPDVGSLTQRDHRRRPCESQRARWRRGSVRARARECPRRPKSVCIESPMVGTYYASNAPDAPPFVSLASIVQPNTIVCIIEAMKVFTDIPAGVSGTVAEVLVKNGQAVEYGQPLFRVIPA